MNHFVVLTWQAPADATAGSLYNIYRATGGCPASGLGTLAFSKIGSGLSALTFTDSSVVVGNSYCYYGTQTQGSVEAAPGNTAGGTIRPSTITIQLVLS